MLPGRPQVPVYARRVRPAAVECVVLPPIETSEWTKEGLNAEIASIRDLYLDVLES